MLKIIYKIYLLDDAALRRRPDTGSSERHNVFWGCFAVVLGEAHHSTHIATMPCAFF